MALFDILGTACREDTSDPEKYERLFEEFRQALEQLEGTIRALDSLTSGGGGRGVSLEVEIADAIKDFDALSDAFYGKEEE